MCLEMFRGVGNEFGHGQQFLNNVNKPKKSKFNISFEIGLNSGKYGVL